RVFTSSFVPMYHAVTERRPRAQMKLVTVGPEQRIVGIHVLGAGADEMLQGFAVALHARPAVLPRTPGALVVRGASTATRPAAGALSRAAARRVAMKQRAQ